jgi:hypothetical protein
MILNRCCTFSRLIALAAAIFLTCSNLDNIPDCPELLASKNASSTSLNAVHHPVADLSRVSVISRILPPPTFENPLMLESQPVMLPCTGFRLLSHAADSSPPAG